ncbi:MAG: cell surface protein SprA [Rhodothermales bacterium]
MHRSKEQRPFRMFVSVMSVALILLTGMIATSAASHDALLWQELRQIAIAPADTDSVAVNAGDLISISSDTSDTLADTSIVSRYIPLFKRDKMSSSLFPRRQRPLSTRLGNYWRHEIALDSTENSYYVTESVGKLSVRYPVQIDYDSYRQLRLKVGIDKEFERLAEQSAQRRRLQQRTGGLGFNIIVPGGRESAFSSIFGTTDIDLRVNGQANINAGFNIRQSDQQTALTGKATQVDPEFRQDLRLGIVGRIGDKMNIDVNWDTERDFDYQNQLKLHYEGYDDDIIKSIEAGNVFLQTPSTLIRGGQSLFGIKSEFQIGGIQFQTVISQQEGQSNNLSIDGGSEPETIEIEPIRYDEKSHFFLSYYFRNRWEPALAAPPLITVADGFERITRVEVWKLQVTSSEDQLRAAIAVIDLGEEPAVRTEANNYTATVLPNPANDVWDETTLTKELLDQQGLGGHDFQTGDMIKLEEGLDYEFDDLLGYISLRQGMQESEALAVAFEYVANGQQFKVGEFAGDKPNVDSRLVLKLLRPTTLQQPNPGGGFNPAAWYLELRNLYRLNGRGINSTDFELQVNYEAPGSPGSRTLPGIGRGATLLQILGLDRLNVDEALRPDDNFDYLDGYTIDPGRGLLIFPYLEPFGKRIQDVIEETVAEEEQQAAIDKFVYSSLYQKKKDNAQLDTQLDVYRINGSYKGAVKAFYNLNAFAGVIPGSVRVTAGGAPLTEGADYTVDYNGGTVSITNPAFLTAGRNIEIDYESNSLFNIQKKTLMGARAFYEYEDKFLVGTTLMRLNQKSPVDKYRLGEEPISNTIWGVDGNMKLEPRWLTRAVDALPLIQTRAPSIIRFSGEFAQLRPGHTETSAFRRSRSDLQRTGRDFNSDELSGISYVDDFEGFETTFSLKQAGAWQITSPPDSIREEVEPDPALPRTTRDSLRTNWRSTFAWYTLNNNTLRTLGDRIRVTSEASIRQVLIEDVFPDRDTEGEPIKTLTTLDLYFDPTERGPYNYNRDLATFLRQPKNAWGGMIQRLPDGFNDFNVKNIEFVEFIIQAIPEGQSDTGPDAKLFVDLGTISEDVIPNGELNNEDGLSLSSVGARTDQWSRLPSVIPDKVINVRDDRTEDLGLDGLVSYDPDSYDELSREHVVFQDYLETLQANNTGDPKYAEELAKILIDPSGDDYHYFENDQYFESGVYRQKTTLQQRFSRYFPTSELNAFETQNKLANNTSIKRGNIQYPDTEDLNINTTVDTQNDYFQYEVPLSKAVLDQQGQPDQLDDYVVGEITSEGVGTGWYLIRIPVQNETRRVGNLQDFTLIESMRLWTTGHEVPVTLRLASLELVGSQWRKSPPVDAELIDEDFVPASQDNTRLTISSVNNEEDGIYIPPPGTIISQTRLSTGTAQDAREQSMVIRVENLQPGTQRAISKTYPNDLDLLRYSNMRLFVHMHGELWDGTDLKSLERNESREKVKLFIRLGANETNDYYEYEQPLTPAEFGSSNQDEIWQTNQMFGDEFLDLNSVNIVLGALNQLKVARDEFDNNGLPFPTDSLFWNTQDGSVNVDFAPPGTRIGIKGTPSLGRVNTIVMGIRNPVPEGDDIGDELGDVTVWVNELRTSGYDETNGWAALANVDIKLADLGGIKANLRRQTDGFGSLESSLGERDQNDLNNWSVAGDLNLDKLIPERAGWSIPVSGQIQSNTSTPKFAPSRGDVRLQEITDQIQGQDLSPEEKQERIRETREAAQAYSYTRSMSFRVSKRNSKWALMRILVDGLSLNYSYTDKESRNPSQKLNDSWRWSSNLSYLLNVPQPKTLRPFWFLESIPVIGLLGDLRFNYLPQSIKASASASRNFSEAQQRVSGRLSALEELSTSPVREQHTFSHRRNVSVQYNPFQFLNLSFDTSTNQSLNQLGVDTLHSVIDLNTDSLYRNVNIADSVRLAAFGISPDQVGVSAFGVEQLQIVSARKALSGLFTNDSDLRTEQHDQRFNATFQPNFNRNGFLNWVNVQPVTYTVQYAWQNGATGRVTGANIRNQVSIRSGITLRPIDLWRKIPFYERMEEEQRKSEQEKQTKIRERDQRRQTKRDEKKERKEKRKEEKKAAALKKQEDEARLEIENIARKERGEDKISLEEFLEAERALLEMLEAADAQEDAANEENADDVANPDDVENSDVQQQEEAENAANADFEEGDEEAAANAAVDQVAQDSLGNPVPGEGILEQEKKKRLVTLPKLKPLSLVRRIALAATGVRDLSVNYTASRNSASSNVGIPQFNTAGEISDVTVNYSLIEALFNGNGPPISYRFGLDRKIPIANRIVTNNLQVTDVLSDNNRVQAQTALNPSSNLTINLTWSLDWGNNTNFTFRPIDDGLGTIDETRTERGNNSASIWAFRANYTDLFSKQLGAYADDAALAANLNELGDENNDGRVVLTNKTLVADFLDTYLNGNRSLDGTRALLRFPMPSWRVNYTGLSNWPLFQLFAQKVTVRHGYSADYTTDFRTNLISDPTDQFLLGSKSISYDIAGVETGAVRINERFSPLVGFDLDFKNQIQTNLAWNKTNIYSLSSTSFEVNETETSELSFSASYQKRGLKLPFFKKKLDNRVSFKFTMSRAVVNDQRFRLRRALEEAIDAFDNDEVYDPALASEGDNASVISASVRLTLAPQISYQFSNRVSGDFRLLIEDFNSEDSRTPSSKVISGTFNIRVSIQN